MIQVACVDISEIDLPRYRQLYDQASAQRKQRADRCRRMEDKIRCVTADALLRYALWNTLNVAEFDIEQGDYGKPRVKDAENFHYNLSHSGRWVVIAYGDSPVGVDVEQIQMDAGKENLARRWFTADEQEFVFGASESRRAERFFQIWTGKESYLKYLGTGLTRPLNSFTVLPDGGHLNVRLRSVFLDGGCLTLCSKEENDTLVLLSVQNLIDHKA